jgi:hypothetical protein
MFVLRKAMHAPVSLRNGKILLLAGQDSFSAAYVRHMLDRCGVPVLTWDKGDHGSSNDALSGASTLKAGIVADVEPGQIGVVAECQPGLPILFIGDPGDTPLPQSCRALRPPFASYQVVELLDDMVRERKAAAPVVQLRVVATEPQQSPRHLGT